MSSSTGELPAIDDNALADADEGLTHRIGSWAGGAVAVIALALLGVAAVGGLYVRPAADDWCVAWRARDTGIGGLVHYFYYDVNGRVANAVFNGAVYSEGLRGPRILPALLAISLFLGLFILSVMTLRRVGWRAPVLVIGAVAAALTAITFFAGRVVYQVFFWTPGSVSHTIPAILGVWTLIVGLAALRARRRWARPVAALVAGVVGFTIGSLSEPFVAVSGVYAAGLLVFGFVQLRRRRNWYVVAWPAAWIAGLIVGFGLLYTSPGLALRSGKIDQPSTLSFAGISDVLHGWVNTWQVVAAEPAYFGAVVVGVLIGATSRRVADLPWARLDTARDRLIWLGLPLVLVMASSFAVIMGLRMGYGTNGWLYERTWTNFMVPALVTAAYYGALLGQVIVNLPQAGRRLSVAVVVIGALLGVGSVASLAPRTWHLTDATIARAQVWDQENARLKSQVRQGAEVLAFTPHRIGNLSEPFTYRDYRLDWVSNCASAYYHVERLKPAKSWLASDDSKAYRGAK